ncbi:anthranilate phosphoribosyltransferase [Ammonifex degensii KC4]|uniref:Anthranilate phosphoribosyltransferase n=1 Tax=Ammonifex degensii (strain DSM 10501 / KC4) TaxID=429009 RepID=C9RDF0_AMMDK|nr:anthranilate phosphoribosyltransferase [Ammonifex degensii]ACX52277.1 anthranilate phosphoribosyltransferase [Ammonifex degensii KC4]
MALREALAKLARKEDLTLEEAREVMGVVMEGKATPAQIGALLMALRLKGEKVPEVAGFAQAMRERALRYQPRHPVTVDTCGTGGDGTGSFNVSTTAAFVVAACGCPVAKHGNRSVSSRAGSADLLEALGAKVDLPPELAGRCLDEVGFGFFFAPRCHPAMRHAAGPRRELGVRTVFNILGPLCNPAGAQVQVVGVYHPDLLELVAEVLLTLGTKRALVVHGAGGMDEASPVGEVLYAEVRGGEIRRGKFDPADYGFPRCRLSDLRGGTAQDNAAITRAILQGEKGPRTDAVVLNAALALVAAEKAEDLQEGVEMARRALERGEALAKLEEYLNFCRQVTEFAGENPDA